MSTMFNYSSSASSDTTAGDNVNFEMTTTEGSSSYNLDLSDSSGTGHYAGYYWPWYEPYREYHYHHHHVRPSGNDFETAFKIAKKLCTKKVVPASKQKTIGDFFKLMDIILEVLRG